MRIEKIELKTPDNKGYANVQLLKHFNCQQIKQDNLYRLITKLCAQFAAVVVLAVVLAGCSEDRGVGLSTDSQLQLSPPGLERLRRMIDTSTLEARIAVTSGDNTQSVNANPTASADGNRTASVQVPRGVPFSIEVIWSASGVDYAIFTDSYSGVKQNTSININIDQYDLSATAFDSDGDGTSNFDELVAGSLEGGDAPIVNSALAYYSMDSGQAIDASGNNRNGTVIGGVAAADERGAADSAIRLGASMEHISVPASVVEGLRDFTILFKVNFDTFNEGNVQYNTIFSIASQQNHEISFAYAHNETFLGLSKRFYLVSDGAGNIPFFVLFEQLNTITPNTWYCVAVYREGGTVGMMVDGELIGDGEAEFSTAAIRVDEGGFLIGQQQSGNIGGTLDADKALAGVVDEFYVFDNALELQDVRNYCN